MRNYGSDFPRGDRPALDEVAQTDLLLDALAARTECELDGSSDFQDLDDQALAALLGEWRDDLRWPPASALVSKEEAEEALRAGMADRRGGRRGLAAVGSVAATLLALSGFGAVVADAKPGDLLYGLHAMMFNEPRVSDDQIVLSAKADLAKVEQMIAQGQWDQAQTQLAEVSNTLQAVNEGSRKQGLLAEVNQLNTKVEKRDPKATAPAAPPSTALAVPSAPNAPATLTPPLDPAAQEPPPAVEAPPAELPQATEPTSSPTGTPPATTTSNSSAPTTTTTRPNAATTPPPTSEPSPTPTPTSKGKQQPSTSATPSVTPHSPAANSPAAGPVSPAPSTPSGELWDRTTGPARPSVPRTPFPAQP